MLAFAIGAALAAQPAALLQPEAATFELPPAAKKAANQFVPAPLAPVPPRNLDLRNLDAPEAEWRVAEDGPLLIIGAMGGRRAGMPKLAHVALDWSF